MSISKLKSGAYTGLVVALWAVALPAVLIADAGVGAIPWRGSIPAIFATFVGLVGVTLVGVGAISLSQAGVGLLGLAPGAALVTEGVYERIRNPIDLGTVLLSLAPWMALDVELMWVVPAGTLVWLIAGVGPYEDRRLAEVFDEDFDRYRTTVGKWVPRNR